jgi:hypothetical protein
MVQLFKEWMLLNIISMQIKRIEGFIMTVHLELLQQLDVLVDQMITDDQVNQHL